MLKLTRYLYAADPSSKYFDYYERTHLNHILAQQNPSTGMFAYMVPLMSGTHREFSTPFDDFWCCVGTGMESHAKHGDSIFWLEGSDVIVNLYIPATLTLPGRGIALRLETEYPFGDDVALTISRGSGPAPCTLSLRIPDWCKHPRIELNGAYVAAQPLDGYLRLRRTWRRGDVIRLALPRTLRMEATADDPSTVAWLFGPLVLAADLGPATASWHGEAPALVGVGLAERMLPHAASTFTTDGIGRPADLVLRPFAFQHERNTAVYFRCFTEAAWTESQAAFAAEQLRLERLRARSADTVDLGDSQSEEQHGLRSKISYAVTYRGRSGRDARSGGFFECTVQAKPGPLTLQAVYWGEERERRFLISIDGELLAREQLDGDGPSDFVERDYPVPEALSAGKRTLRIRFEPEPGFSAGPAFGLRLFSTATSA
jgi:hypothetical protein